MDTVVAQSDTRPDAPAAWPVVWLVLLILAAGGTVLAGTIAGAGGAGGFLPILAFMVCLLAAWFDAGTGKIPNALTYMAIALGVALSIAGTLLKARGILPAWLGGSPLEDVLLGVGIFGAAGIMALLVAGLGGGDMKLIVALAAMLGLHGATPVVFWGLSAAMVYALFNLIARGKLNVVMQMLSLQVLSILYLRQAAEVEPLPGKKIPLALPMALGMIVAKLLPLEVLSG